MARADFTDQQWQQLVEAGPAIARAVAAASGSLARTEQELEAFLHLLETTRDATSSATLLGSLASDVHARLSSGALALADDDVVADGIHAARQAGAVLAVEPDEQEARAVRYWLMEIARTVAGASREGGLLGIGGEDVSRPERELITTIGDALGSGIEGEAAAPAQATEAAPAPDVAPDGQPVGADNIRHGTVGGVMGGPNQSEGEGQGG